MDYTSGTCLLAVIDSQVRRSSAIVMLIGSVSAIACPNVAFADIVEGSGRHVVVMEAAEGLPTHTVYRPRNLKRFGSDVKLPIVAWGNGGCVDAGDAQKNFLAEVASHGMLVIATGPIRAPQAGPREPEPRRPTAAAPAGPPRNAPPTRAEQLTEAVDWALAENARSDSPWHGKLDEDAIALMGYSCGGLQALARSRDSRVRTTVLWNSGVLPPNDRRAGMDVDKQMLSDLHAPIAYISGGPSDIAYANARDDFGRIDGVPVFWGNLDVGHGGTYAERFGGAFGRVAVAWLKWQLRDDAEAGRIFIGENCGLCEDPKWTVAKRGID